MKREKERDQEQKSRNDDFCKGQRTEFEGRGGVNSKEKNKATYETGSSPN